MRRHRGEKRIVENKTTTRGKKMCISSNFEISSSFGTVRTCAQRTIISRTWPTDVCVCASLTYARGHTDAGDVASSTAIIYYVSSITAEGSASHRTRIRARTKSNDVHTRLCRCRRHVHTHTITHRIDQRVLPSYNAIHTYYPLKARGKNARVYSGCA